MGQFLAVRSSGFLESPMEVLDLRVEPTILDSQLISLGAELFVLSSEDGLALDECRPQPLGLGESLLSVDVQTDLLGDGRVEVRLALQE